MGILESIMADAQVPPITTHSLGQVLNSCRQEAGRDPPSRIYSEDKARRIAIENVDMYSPINALLEAEHIPTILPNSLNGILSKSRRKHGLLLSISGST